MSSLSTVEQGSTTIINPLEYTSLFGTKNPATPPTGSLLSSSTNGNILEYVYVVSFTDTGNGPFTTSFTRSSNPTSEPPVVSGASQSSSPSPQMHPSMNSSTTATKTTRSSGLSSTTYRDPHVTEVIPATETATVAQAVHNKVAISSGAIAGVAIACAVLGAIITAAFFGYCIRQRNRDGTKRSVKASSKPEQTNAFESDRKSSIRPATAPSDPEVVPSRIDVLATVLPLPMQDRSIIEEFSRLGSSIKNHAQSFYGGINAHASTTTKISPASRIAMLFENHLYSDKDIVALLREPHFRVMAVRIVLISAILKGIDSSCTAEWMLLPHEIASCMTQIRASKTSDDNRTVLFSKWRHINGSLLDPNYGVQFESDDARQSSIIRMMRDLDTLLQPFASLESDDERRRNMVEILKRGARFGYTLSTQPTEWEFDWTSGSDSTSATIVVFPGMLQTVNDQGRRNDSNVRVGQPAQTMAIE